MTDRATKERKLIALMISDLELDLERLEMIEVENEVRALPDEELDRTLASRLDLPYPVDEQAMEQALSRIEETELPLGAEAGSVSGTTDVSHELRPGEHEG
jgi:hypothetical protein